MGLTEAKIKDLEDKKFDQLYKKHKDAWMIIAKNAYDFAKNHITEGRNPRPDDVLKILMGMIEVNEDLRNHQEDNNARYRRFKEYFGEYVIDKYLETLAGGAKK